MGSLVIQIGGRVKRLRPAPVSVHALTPPPSALEENMQRRTGSKSSVARCSLVLSRLFCSCLSHTQSAEDGGGWRD